MKLSKYNRFFKVKGKNILFNSFSSCLIELDDELYSNLVSAKFNLIKEDYLNDLKEQFVIVENDELLVNKYKFELLKNRYDREVLSLTITPTYACNFNCSYCYESSRPNVFMDESTENNLISFVKSKNAKELNVTWYGGEPLLAFDQIERLTAKFKELVPDYSADIITNGYLLSKEKIKKLEELSIVQVQITLDGPPEIHNKKRPLLSGKETYSMILENIDNLIPTKVGIVIRVNVDNKNISFFYEHQNTLLTRFPKDRVHIYPGLIENHEDITSCISSKNCLLSNDTFSKFVLDQFFLHNNRNLDFLPSPPDTDCMARSINSFLIGADGDIFKCWFDVGIRNKRIGNINNNKEWNYDILSEYMVAADFLEDPKCTVCILLPSCGGGCPYKRIVNKFYGGNYETCSHKLDNLNKFLEAQYLIDTDQ